MAKRDPPPHPLRNYLDGQNPMRDKLVHRHFAKKLEISEKHLSEILMGKKLPSPALRYRIEQVTGGAVAAGELLEAYEAIVAARSHGTGRPVPETRLHAAPRRRKDGRAALVERVDDRARALARRLGWRIIRGGRA